MFAIAESEENYDSHSNGSIILDKVSNYLILRYINWFLSLMAINKSFRRLKQTLVKSTRE